MVEKKTCLDCCWHILYPVEGNIEHYCVMQDHIIGRPHDTRRMESAQNDFNLCKDFKEEKCDSG